MSYASTSWNPVNSQLLTKKLEQVQRKAARFVYSNWSWESSPSEIIRTLQPWQFNFYCVDIFANFLPTQVNIVQFASAFASAFAICRRELPGLPWDGNLLNSVENKAVSLCCTKLTKSNSYAQGLSAKTLKN